MTTVMGCDYLGKRDIGIAPIHSVDTVSELRLVGAGVAKAG